jgi:tetratricopeptide (TPR) repeat protein
MRYRILLAVVLATLASGVAVGGDARWLDLEGRIQYGYFTEDLRALRNLVEPLASSDSRDPLKSYYSALLAYRLSQVSAARQPPPSEARNLVEQCVASLDSALKEQRDFAEALALQSACLAVLAPHGAWKSPFAAPRSATQLHKALDLAPKNPRVVLIDAIDASEHSKAGADPARSCAKFATAAALFETERADVDRVPGWGAAEAYLWLGRCYLDNGNANAARDALERSLLIAPEFAEARRLLSRITSG